jgi:hypothetical protein
MIRYSNQVVSVEKCWLLADDLKRDKLLVMDPPMPKGEPQKWPR